MRGMGAKLAFRINLSLCFFACDRREKRPTKRRILLNERKELYMKDYPYFHIDDPIRRAADKTMEDIAAAMARLEETQNYNQQ